jgi:arachidonate 5-lipoxygenase
MTGKKFSFLTFIKKRLMAFSDKVVLWITARLLGIGLAIFLCFPFRYRMSHNNGIGAKGKLRIVENPKFPAHDFFSAGQEYPVRIRHASATFLDDAMNCIRSISIKFSHHHFKSPFDIEMNTGETSLFWSAVSFLKFAKSKKEKWGVEYVEYNRKYPEGLTGAQLAVRRHASSFHNLHYYSKTPFLFRGKDNIKHYAKYRVLPFENEKETGIDTDPSEWDTSNQRILPHETRGRNYLKNEYEQRVQSQGAKYRMQIQTRIASDDDDDEIFNNMILWDDRIYPWYDLLVIDIDTVLDWKESTMTSFSVNNMPKTLGVLPAKSIYDYNSLNYLRSKSEIARLARLFSYKVFGMVPPIPDDDDRNTGNWSKPKF